MRQARARFCRPYVERLERRVLLADIKWLGAANNDWHNAANWDTGTVPDTGDVVILDKLGGSTIQLSAAQTKDVRISARRGDTVLGLNGHDFHYVSLDTRGRSQPRSPSKVPVR